MAHDRNHWRLGFAGFGRVNRALARMLAARRGELAERWGASFDITMLSTATRGALVEPNGLDAERAFEKGWSSGIGTPEAIRSAPIDLLFEGTTLDPARGEPALSHVRAALERGVSVVSANKGPFAFAAAELMRIARRQGAGLRFESTVADCLPIFNFFEVVVPVGRIRSFRGVLNATSNLVLQAMARELPAGDTIARVQRLGLAEADPAHDLDGWDQAVKAVIVANVLMGRDARPADVERVPVSAVDIGWVRREEAAGRTVKLVAQGDDQGALRVGPVSCPHGSFLASLHGGSLGIEFDTELAGTLTLGSVEPQVNQTAYGMLTDFLAIHAGRTLIPMPLRPEKA